MEQGTYILTNICKMEKSQLVPSFLVQIANVIDMGAEGNILGFQALTTWEWRPHLPVRSILPIFATTGLPLLGLRLLFGREEFPSYL